MRVRRRVSGASLAVLMVTSMLVLTTGATAAEPGEGSGGSRSGFPAGPRDVLG